MRSSRFFVVLLIVASSACGGLIDTDAPPPIIDADGDPLGSGGAVQAQCSPAQWDCSGQTVTCDYADGPAQNQPIIGVLGTCRCDSSRPVRPSDCAAGDLFVCGSLSFSSRDSADGLSFEPVSCRCATNAGYYCSHCTKTGLYASEADAAGCGLETSTGQASGAVYCGCGE